MGMDKTARLSLLALLLTVPAAAQNRARVQAPTVPVIGGPALTGASIAGLKAPSLAAPVLPTLSMPSVQPALPAAASVLPRADAVADVIPGVRDWPRVMGVGLASPHDYNGVKDEKKAETPAPKKSDDEKPIGKWEAIGTGLLLAALLAGSLFAWYTLYASMGEVMRQGEQQLYEQYYGPVPTIDEIFGGR